MFLLGVFVLAVLSGGTASVAGFGIGSLLTPLLAASFRNRDRRCCRGDSSRGRNRAPMLAPASQHRLECPSRVRSAERGGRARRRASLHALLQRRADADAWPAARLDSPRDPRRPAFSRSRHRRSSSALLGLLSGLFGGLAGNQGGLRAAAMLSLSLSPVRYVATATATAMLVDIVRTPIYVWRAGGVLTSLVLPLSVATAGVLIGTCSASGSCWACRYASSDTPSPSLIGLLGLWLVVQGVN